MTYKGGVLERLRLPEWTRGWSGDESRVKGSGSVDWSVAARRLSLASVAAAKAAAICVVGNEWGY